MEPAEQQIILEAVHDKIKRQIKGNISPEKSVTLNERRAHDKANISAIIKKNRNLLVPWSQIMNILI